MTKIVKVLILTQIERNPNPVVLTRGVFASRGQMAIFEDIFGCHDWGRGWLLGSSGLETGDSAEHSTMHRTGTMTKNYPAQNVNSVRMRNPDPSPDPTNGVLRSICATGQSIL